MPDPRASRREGRRREAPPVRALPTPEEVRAAAAAAAAAHPAWPPLTELGAQLPLVLRPQEGLVDAGLRLARVRGARLTLPRAYYAAALAAGEFGEADIALALERLRGDLPHDLGPARVVARMAAPETDPASFRIPTVLDLVGRVARLDWRRLVLDRLARFCAERFDPGVAPWAGADSDRDAWAAFREEMCVDRGFELRGLPDSRARFAALPADGDALLHEVVVRIGVPRDGLEVWCERLLADLAGWHGLERWWRDTPEAAARGLLPLRAAFELLMQETWGDVGSGVALGWESARLRLLEDDGARWRLHRAVDHVLHVASEIGAQRRLTERLSVPARPASPARSAAEGAARPIGQFLCCTDVRSERLRRALEAGGDAETFGTVGDFDLPAALTVPAEAPPGVAAGLAEALAAMRSGGVSAFAHVEALGLLFAPRMLRDALGLRAIRAGHGAAPLPAAPTGPAGIDAAERLLRTAGLTERLAPIVVLVGHGAASVGDPHASVEQCAACGGRASDVAARSGARLLNDTAVRAGLAERGIAIPRDTVFLAALHDTARDELELLDGDVAPAAAAAVEALRAALATAARRLRAERDAVPGAAGRRRRSRDYSSVRPEAGQAACRAFLAAPRALTRDLDLDATCRLHSYDPDHDPDGSVLARVLGRSLVIAAHTTLQYHLAAVDPVHFGAGDRTLVDVLGSVGVLEGNDGALRTGLPLQSVHDGRRIAHAPGRLDARIMASPSAIDAVLAQDPTLRLLVSGGWLTLEALDRSGRASHHLEPRSGWRAVAAAPGPTEDAA